MSDGEDIGSELAGKTSATTQRLDKWLWCARVVKTRTQAAALVSGGKVRVNRVKTDKPAYAVKAGDVVTASVGARVRVLAVKAVGDRRGSADIARSLFDDLTAPIVAAGAELGSSSDASVAPTGRRDNGTGRPTKRDRRLIDRLKGED
jgi:ribosome-associated heat shock protein Hsp15